MSLTTIDAVDPAFTILRFNVAGNPSALVDHARVRAPRALKFAEHRPPLASAANGNGRRSLRRTRAATIVSDIARLTRWSQGALGEPALRGLQLADRLLGIFALSLPRYHFLASIRKADIRSG